MMKAKVSIAPTAGQTEYMIALLSQSQPSQRNVSVDDINELEAAGFVRIDRTYYRWILTAKGMRYLRIS